MFSFLKKKEEKFQLKAYLSGKAIPITEVKDEVFSSKMMGDGLAIIPTTNIVKAPGKGEITVVMGESKHAVGIKFENGAEALIHVGIDTVSMNGEGFEVFVNVGDKVNAGDKLIEFNPSLIKEKGFVSDTMLIITNHSDYPNMKIKAGQDVTCEEDVVVEF